MPNFDYPEVPKCPKCSHSPIQSPSSQLADVVESVGIEETLSLLRFIIAEKAQLPFNGGHGNDGQDLKKEWAELDDLVGMASSQSNRLANILYLRDGRTSIAGH